MSPAETAPDRGKLQRRPPRLSALVLLGALLAGALLAGCGKDNPAKPNPGPQYPPLSTPQNVLSAMIQAYASRDSTEYKLVYDQTLYLGESFDQAQYPVTADSFYWGDEARHISALARATDVMKVEMDFGSWSTWTRLASPYIVDPPGSALITLANPKLTIYLVGDNGLLMSGVQHEFRFAPTVAAPGDTTWKIIHWTEIRTF